jgi:hypothetical protein
MDVFLRFDNVGADLVARTISPFVVKTADYNFSESARFIEQLSIAAERNPDAVEELALQMNQLQPQVRSQFIEVTKRTAKRAETHGLGMSSAPGPNNSLRTHPQELIKSWQSTSRIPTAVRGEVAPEKPEVILRR